MDKVIGLEILHTLVKEELTSKQDCLVVAIHCMFVGLKRLCVGLGDTWSDEKGSELLPKGWNLNNEVYTLRYISADKTKYLVTMATLGKELMVSVLDVEKNKCENQTFDIDHLIADNIQHFSSAYSNLAELVEKFEKLVPKSVEKQPVDNVCDTQQKSVQGISVPITNRSNDDFSSSAHIRSPHLPSVGRGDLDPFGGAMSGGGMLFDPSFHNRPPFAFPHGPRAPPGARILPTHPYQQNPEWPDPDHLPPPGYNDIFM